MKPEHAPARSSFLVFAFLFAILTSLIGPPLAGAQTTLGTIRGTIFDQQQSIVPGVTVIVTDEATGVSRETQSDTQGLYEVSNLRSGTYTVTASLSGFKKVQRTGIVLRRGRRRARGHSS